MTSAGTRLQVVQDTIARACAAARRDASSVTLVAVSKQKPASDVLAMAAAGVRHFGENRLEEAAVKIPQVDALWDGPPLTWHMIGHVQSRKARAVGTLFDWVHSVDSVALAHKLGAAAHDAGRAPLKALVQVNISGEASKSGLDGHNWAHDPALVVRLCRTLVDVARAPSLDVCGLMTIAPFDAPDAALCDVFTGLAALRDVLAARTGHPLPYLSMGMTDDYPLAIAAGATHIRVGRALFDEHA